MNTLLKKLFVVLILLHNGSATADENELQTQFTQGLKLIKEKNYDQAVPIFSKLIKEHPSLPEPYNNLAFIYATQGHLMKAQETLQAAFKNNPSYALVYENLNAIYAKISRSIYEKAIGADDTSREPLKNLFIIDRIFDKTEPQTAVQFNAPEQKEIPASSENSLPGNLPTLTSPSAFTPESK